MRWMLMVAAPKRMTRYVSNVINSSASVSRYCELTIAFALHAQEPAQGDITASASMTGLLGSAASFVVKAFGGSAKKPTKADQLKVLSAAAAARKVSHTLSQRSSGYLADVSIFFFWAGVGPGGERKEEGAHKGANGATSPRGCPEEGRG